MKMISFSVPKCAGVTSAFFLFFLNFNALYNYGSGYDTRILAVNFIFFLMVFAWYVVGKKSKVPLFGLIIVIILFISLVIIYCNKIFDNFNGSIDIATAISSGLVSHDLLWHSSIAESITNYQLPSILINNLDIIHYHFFSHMIIALISKMTQLPVFFVYNYIYPQIFITFFLYLYFRLIVSIGDHFSCNQLISTLAGGILLLLQATLMDPLLIMVRSQSFFISILFCLLYFNTLEKFNLYTICSIRSHIVIFNVLTLFSLFIISITKISTGLIFLAVCSWFNLRLPQPIWKKITILFSYASLYLIALIICVDISSGAAEPRLPNLTHYITYINVLFPCIAIIGVILGFRIYFLKKPIKKIIARKYAILEECLLIGLILCFFLSLILTSHWFLYYFTVTLSFFSLLVFFVILARSYLMNLKNYLLKFKYFSLILFISLSFILFPPLVQNFSQFSTLFFNLKYQRSVQSGTEKIAEILSFRKYFSKSKFFNSKAYRIIWTIREISRGHRNQYGLYISDNNSLKLVRPFAHIFYYQGLTGVVRYAPLYQTDNGLFSSGGNLVTKDVTYPYYGLKNIYIPHTVSLDYAQRLAKADGKKFLFNIDHDNLYLINLETKSSELVKLQAP